MPADPHRYPYFIAQAAPPRQGRSSGPDPHDEQIVGAGRDEAAGPEVDRAREMPAEEHVAVAVERGRDADLLPALAVRVAPDVLAVGVEFGEDEALRADR